MPPRRLPSAAYRVIHCATCIRIFRGISMGTFRYSGGIGYNDAALKPSASVGWWCTQCTHEYDNDHEQESHADSGAKTCSWLPAPWQVFPPAFPSSVRHASSLLPVRTRQRCKPELLSAQCACQVFRTVRSFGVVSCGFPDLQSVFADPIITFPWHQGRSWAHCLQTPGSTPYRPCGHGFCTTDPRFEI